MSSSHAVDQAFCGLTAGICSTLVMHPLDLIKVKFQVDSGDSKGKGKARLGIGREMWFSLGDIGRRDGIKGLYRGLTPNLIGNASSWGLYFLWYGVCCLLSFWHAS